MFFFTQKYFIHFFCAFLLVNKDRRGVVLVDVDVFCCVYMVDFMWFQYYFLPLVVGLCGSYCRGCIRIEGAFCFISMGESVRSDGGFCTG